MRFSTMPLVLIFVMLKPKHTTNNENGCRCVSLFQCDDGSDFERNIELRSTEGVVVRKKEDCDTLEICCEFEHILPPPPQIIISEVCGARSFVKIDSSAASSSRYEAKFGEFPWTIAVLHNRPDKQDEYICDGALIHRKIVLTAAHCVNGKPASKIKIRAGEWDTQSIYESLPHQDRAVENILIRGNYTSRLFRNDVALLVLSRSLEITNNVNTICLPKSINDLAITQCVTSGWSRNRLDGTYQTIMRKAEFQIVSRDICQQTLYKAYRLKNKSVLDGSFICGDDIYGHDTWKGDGGSPFVCPLKFDSHRFAQIGVAVPIFRRSTRPFNIFANVLHARSWIDEQLLFHNLDNTVYEYAHENHDCTMKNDLRFYAP